jgi:hypothetical protein
MPTYTCYGLRIESALVLPELLIPTDESSEAAPIDVIINFGEISPDGLPDAKQLGPYIWVTDQSLWLEVPYVARFLISDGNQITIDPAPGIDEDSIRVFLLGSGLGVLLFQRGFLVLHGNAIRIGDQSMICVGHSGTGKSTLAAGFAKRGYNIVADDVVPVDANCSVLPGFPRLKLWQDTAEQLGIETSELRRIRPELYKFNYPLHDRFAHQTLPIRWVYILSTHKEPDIKFKAIRGLQRFNHLRNNTYRIRFMEGQLLKVQHLKRCGQLAGRIHLSRVTRPDQGFELDPLIDSILADIEAHS